MGDLTIPAFGAVPVDATIPGGNGRYSMSMATSRVEAESVRMMLGGSILGSLFPATESFDGEHPKVTIKTSSRLHHNIKLTCSGRRKLLTCFMHREVETV